MKIAYITAHTPFGSGETFVMEEILTMADLGAEILIIPRNPPKEVYHGQAKQLLNHAVWLPLISMRILFHFLKALAMNSRMRSLLLAIFKNSRTPKILLKNLAVTPKAVFVAEMIRHAGIQHIHAHWGSTTSTIGWLASEISSIPWSMTLHRWDIAENNMLELKVESAAFTRCISREGQREALSIIGDDYKAKLTVIHMGAKVRASSYDLHRVLQSEFTIVCPANLVQVKGHRYLIEALRLIIETEDTSMNCLIIGDGPLEGEIRRQVYRLGLGGVIHLVGQLPHEKLMLMYEKKEVDAVVLPSILTDDGEKEGIPVSLMEAMNYGIPVISTNTGGIPELLSGGAGILVKEKSIKELADAISTLIKNKEAYREIVYRGFQKIHEEFNIRKNTSLLLEIMKENRFKQ